MIIWDSTGSGNAKVWHTDISNVGRYSVQYRPGRKKSHRAFLNGRALSPPVVGNINECKAAVQERIQTAKRIADAPWEPCAQCTDPMDCGSWKTCKQSPATNSTHIVRRIHAGQKVWLANWATPEDADATNEDHDATAYDLAHPAGVILTALNTDTIDKVQTLAIQEWIEVLGSTSNGVVVEQAQKYRAATWIEEKSKATEGISSIYRLTPKQGLIYGVLIIRECTTIIGG